MTSPPCVSVSHSEGDSFHLLSKDLFVANFVVQWVRLLPAMLASQLLLLIQLPAHAPEEAADDATHVGDLGGVLGS